MVLATSNQDKIIEIRHLLQDLPVQIVALTDFSDVPQVVEDQATLEGNAVKKAQLISQFTGLPALADDTGLEVDCLKGAPGVLSARYAGEDASYSDNVAKLLLEMKSVPTEQRQARFRCVIALANGRSIETVEGSCEGLIANKPKGTGGFGYDPVFYVPEYGQTFAEMSLELKNQISHRGRALRKAKQYLVDQLQRNGA